MKMLTMDPKKRLTADEALGIWIKSLHHQILFMNPLGNIDSPKTCYSSEPEHPWLKEGGEASDKPIDSVVQIRMKQFRAMNKLKKLALKVFIQFP